MCVLVAGSCPPIIFLTEQARLDEFALRMGARGSAENAE